MAHVIQHDLQGFIVEWRQTILVIFCTSGSVAYIIPSAAIPFCRTLEYCSKSMILIYLYVICSLLCCSVAGDVEVR